MLTEPMESGDDTTFDEHDSAPFVPKCVVVDPDFDWRGEPDRQAIPWDRTIVYETHVKGFTKRHPKVDEKLRGTYAGPRRQGRYGLHPFARPHLSRIAADPFIRE